MTRRSISFCGRFTMISYEQTSYRGLFHFVRYIDKLIRYEVDFGAALAENGSEDLVRIMTIHASKGLEFPIVFVAGLGRRFNRQDAAGMLVREAGIGVGMNYIDPDRRVQVPTLIKSAAAERVIREGIGGSGADADQKRGGRAGDPGRDRGG